MQNLKLVTVAVAVVLCAAWRGVADAQTVAPVARDDAPPAPAASARTSSGDSAADASDEAWSPPARRPECETTRWRSAVQGEIRLRDCAVARLEALRARADPEFDDVADAGRALAEFYRLRSGRQQAFIDNGAMGAGLGALGYVASDAAGTLTKNLWGYGALVPVLLVQFNANEPTRDLYFAGQIAAGLLTERYAAMNQRLSLENVYNQADLADHCDQADTRLGQMATWPDAPARTDLRPLMLDLVQRCRDFVLSDGRVNSVQNTAGALRSQWARAYAADLLQLHARLIERDHRLRTTPTGALKMMVSTPLRQVDTLVSGESVQAAIDKIKVLTALDGLGFALASYDLPVPPQPMTTPFVLPPAAAAHMVAAPVTATPCPPAPTACTYDPGDTARWLHATLTRFEVVREQQNLRAVWANGVRQAGQATDLNFAYNVGSNRIDVILRAPQTGTDEASTAPANPAAAR